MYYQRGDFQEAMSALERAMELVDDDPTVTEHLGDAYEKIGRSADALRVYRDALAKTKEAEQTERLKQKIASIENRLMGSR